MGLLSSLFDPRQPLRLRLMRATLLGLLVTACAYRVWLIFRFNPVTHIWSDPLRHWEQGTNALNDSPMALVDPILYQLYIGVLAKLSLKIPVLVAYWTSLLSLLGPWLWYRFLRELLPTRDWALAGWVLLAALPSWSAIYSYFMQETLMLPLLGAALWASWRCRRKADTASFVLAVLAWTFAGLTRGICIPLAAVCMSWLWLAQTHKLARMAAALALLLAILGPLAWRSQVMAGLYAPNGIGTLVQLYHHSGAKELAINFQRQGTSWSYRFESPALLVPPFEPFSNWHSQRQGAADFSIQFNGPQGWQAAKDSLPPWTVERALWLTGDNLTHLFFSHSWPDTNLRRDIGQVNRWLRWLWLPLALSCLIVGMRHRKTMRERLLPALLLTWFIVQGLFPLCVNEGRYRKPFEGLLIAQCLLLAANLRRTSPSAAAETA